MFLNMRLGGFRELLSCRTDAFSVIDMKITYVLKRPHFGGLHGSSSEELDPTVG
ncbi:hypothetical protein [Cognatishimia sp.]|uniref:hypothetical protein n=1 Tax=Cognatishimia sp. TaxID=2211648 RepID=UPI0035151E02|nr:hypothetical protein [Cognatishimia sp.]